MKEVNNDVFITTSTHHMKLCTSAVELASLAAQLKSQHPELNWDQAATEALKGIQACARALRDATNSKANLDGLKELEKRDYLLADPQVQKAVVEQIREGR